MYYYKSFNFSDNSLIIPQISYTVCPTRPRTRHFFNNSKFEKEYVRCVRNEEECVCSVCVVRLIFATRSSGLLTSQPVIKEMPDSVASGTLYIFCAQNFWRDRNKYQILTFLVWISKHLQWTFFFWIPKVCSKLICQNVSNLRS